MARSAETVRRVVLGILGAALVVIGVALLVLPGPGLLLVFGGMVLLSRAVPALDRYVGPLRRRAMRAAEESVSSPWRVACSVLIGVFLVGAGLVWGLVRQVPYSGWATGASLIISGVVLFALLAWSFRRVRDTRQAAPTVPSQRS